MANTGCQTFFALQKAMNRLCGVSLIKDKKTGRAVAELHVLDLTIDR